MNVGPAGPLHQNVLAWNYRDVILSMGQADLQLFHLMLLYFGIWDNEISCAHYNLIFGQTEALHMALWFHQ